MSYPTAHVPPPIVVPGGSACGLVSNWMKHCDQRFRPSTGHRIGQPRIGMGSQP